MLSVNLRVPTRCQQELRPCFAIMKKDFNEDEVGLCISDVFIDSKASVFIDHWPER